LVGADTLESLGRTGGMTDWAEELERLVYPLSVTGRTGDWVLLETGRAREIAQAFRDLIKNRIELEDEISIWRSFMVPEPVVREAAQEPVCASREDIRQAVRDVSREAERRMYVVRIMELEAENVRLRKDQS